MTGREEPDEAMPTSLLGIANKAKSDRKYRFRNLSGELSEGLLLDCWRDINKNAAYGVDKVRAREYAENLGGNIKTLVERLKKGTYRAKLILRKYIPKGKGKFRPLGIPATEDKLLQLGVTRILTSIYEQDFMRSSYGYRPKVGARDAVDKLTVKLQFGRYNYVVEADIRDYFGSMDHQWLLKMLAERIDDRRFLRLIKKWLKAGVLETDGKVIHPVTGTPQGGIVSPILSNVYLHYVLDLWFHKVVAKRCRGEACLIRYADDWVCAFQYKEEAEWFFGELAKRLEKFGLELAEDKTRIIPFNRNNGGKTSFDFLGFEFRWGKDRKGKPHLKRRTSKDKFRASLRRFAEWCKANRHVKLKVLFARLQAKLRGYYNYYGINGNVDALCLYYNKVMVILHKWLNRRSQRRSYTWQGFNDMIEHFAVLRPHIPPTRPRRRMELTVT